MTFQMMQHTTCTEGEYRMMSMLYLLDSISDSITVSFQKSPFHSGRVFLITPANNKIFSALKPIKFFPNNIVPHIWNMLTPSIVRLPEFHLRPQGFEVHLLFDADNLRRWVLFGLLSESVEVSPAQPVWKKKSAPTSALLQVRESRLCFTGRRFWRQSPICRPS